MKAAVLAKEAVEEMSFASGRRISPSFTLRLAMGAIGCYALAARGGSLRFHVIVSVSGAIAGTILGQTARGSYSHTTYGRAKDLADVALTTAFATAVVALAE